MPSVKLLALIVLAFLTLIPHAQAQTDFDYAAFKRIPVAHEGRIKPLDRFAHLLFDGITQGRYETDKAPIELLALTLFDPIGASQENFFHVGNAATRDALDLPHDGTHLYPFQQLNRAFIAKADVIEHLREQDSFNNDEKDILNLYLRVTAFEQTKDALTLVLPLKETKNTLYDGDADAETKRFLEDKGQNNSFLRLIPLAMDTSGTQDWVTPWTWFLQSDTQSEILNDWKNLAYAYIHDDAASWQQTSRDLYQHSIAASHENLAPRLETEIAYQALRPFLIAGVLFALGLIAACFNHRAASWLVWSGIAIHGIGLVMRMVILQRPPVSTLFESTLFIGFVTALIGMGLYHHKKARLYVAIASASALFCALVGYAVNDEQDSLRILDAVLNTRFWLATHVLVITTGYAVSILTALMAHLYLFVRNPAQAFFTLTHKMAIASLLFIAGGTLLGGVWADQSWGRFWGWDPKENGALLIALWLIWLLHAKVEKRFDTTRYMFGLAILGMIVAFSWIGVNLLGVGLHSYGFTSGLASGFVLFCAVDSIFLAYLWKRKSRS